jgi:hypothetical protein
MRILIILSLFLTANWCHAQTDEEKLIGTLKGFHQALVQKNTDAFNKQTDKVLSYGHSNGWVETQTEMAKNLESGYIRYHSFREDSLFIIVNGDMAHARFIADISVTLNGHEAAYRLKVLEVWVRREGKWLLFARQAIKG